MNDCIFCKIVNGDIPSKKLYEDEKVIVIMDANPQVDGHCLVIPKKHLTDITELNNEELNYIFSIAKKMSAKLMDKLNARGLTYCINYGDSQVVKHFHLHLLPDYSIKKKSDKTIDEVYELIKED